ncbi:family 16 glycosylhydrolase [Rubripirellula amarantea]|nr:family 16 glycosylhydrolase [Rubripirellula amarantea]
MNRSYLCKRSQGFFGLWSIAIALAAMPPDRSHAQTIVATNPPTQITTETFYEIDVAYSIADDAIVQVQLFQMLENSWAFIDQVWEPVLDGSTSIAIPFYVPEEAEPEDNYLWQVILYNGSNWEKLDEEIFYPITVSANTPDVITGSNAPPEVQTNESYDVTVEYEISVDGIVQVQLLDSSWNVIDQDWTSVDSGSESATVTIDVPIDQPLADDSIWQIMLYRQDPNTWTKLDEIIAEGIAIVGNMGGPNLEWLPPGNSWALEWQDEFEGTGLPENWYPHLGTNPEEVSNEIAAAAAENRIPEYPLRYGPYDGNNAWMFSTGYGNHWLDGSGNLQLQIRADLNVDLAHGKKVESAYLMSGQPVAWDDSVPGTGVRWEGTLVSPGDGEIYISTRVKTNEMVGYSTWFAFWLFTQTQAYDRVPATGTEIDIIEIPIGEPAWMDGVFNVAHHWGVPTQAELNAGIKFSESLQYSGVIAESLADVTADEYHTYGLRWSADSMTTYVNGVETFTFPDNPPGNPVPAIPANPSDMMMMLTLEFEKDAWVDKTLDDQGDGRFQGTPLEEDANYRVMSRAQVDYVRIWRAQ